MSFELFIARRYLRSKRRAAFISTITYISFFGIALGVAVLIIVSSVMNGFASEVKSRFIGNDAHVRVRAFGDRPYKYSDELTKVLSADSLIAGYSPYIESFGMIKADYTEGALVRGIDQETIENVSPLKSQLIAGTLKLNKQDDDEAPGIILGKGLADRLATIPGEKIRIISPAISSTFSQPPVRTFIVTGIFETGLAEIDGGMCYISLKSAQKLFKLKGKVNGTYVKLNSIEETDKVKDNLNEALEYPLNAISWKDLHRNLYAWMEIEKMMMNLLLSLIVFIAAFNILSGLIMVVMEKKKEIGILLAMGATKQNITRIFVIQGMLVGVAGTLFGLILGYSVSFIQLKYKLFSLPADIYFIEAMPIELKLSDFIIIASASLLLTFVSTIYPSRQAGRTLPADIIRNE